MCGGNEVEKSLVFLLVS